MDYTWWSTASTLEIIMSYVVSILLTACMYGFGPLLFVALRKNPVRKKTVKKIFIIYTVSIWLLDYIATVILFHDASVGMAAILWGMVFYNIAINALRKKGILLEDSIKPEIPKDIGPREIVLVYRQDIKNVEKKKIVKKRPYAIYAIVSVCFLVCIAAAITGWTSAASANHQLSSLQEEMSLYEKKLDSANNSLNTISADRNKISAELTQANRKINELATQSDFLNNEIGFYVPGYDYYHNYKCSILRNSDKFQAHNIEFCKFLGLEKCPLCWEETADDILDKYGATRSDNEKTTGGKFIKLAPKS